MALAKKLHYVKDEVKEACLIRYIEACKNRHALAFFQWRRKFNKDCNNKDLIEIFNTRINHLKVKKERIAKNMKLAEKENIIEPFSSTELPSIQEGSLDLGDADLAIGDSMVEVTEDGQDLRPSSSTETIPLPDVHHIHQIKNKLKSFSNLMDDLSEGSAESPTVIDIQNENKINSFEEINWIDPFPTRRSFRHANKQLQEF